MKKTQMEVWKERPVSWSQLNSWKYNKQQWFNSYILGERFEPNAGMIFGNVVGDTLGLGRKKSMVPNLEKDLKGDKEHKLVVKMNGNTLIGYCDHYCPEKLILNENKTSQNKLRWNQKAVDDHGQLTMYTLMIMLRDKVKPEDIEIWLNYVPVFNRPFGGMHIPDPDEFYRYQTTRTSVQCLNFGAMIQKTLIEMEKYALKTLK